MTYAEEQQILTQVVCGLVSQDILALVAVRGLPGSGKTTVAKDVRAKYPNVVLVSRDDIRDMLFNKRVGLEPADETLVTTQQDMLIRNALRSGHSVIVHDLNLRPQYLTRFREIAKEEAADFYTAEMPLDVEEAVARDRTREAPVGEEVIRNIAKKFLFKGYLPMSAVKSQGSQWEPYAPDANLPKAVIFDLDGTLCGNTGRGWYDHDRYHTDSLNTHIAGLADLLHEDGYIILFVSGRKRIGYESTAMMLSKALPTIWADPETEIFMRATDDDRDDTQVKYELFDAGIRRYYNVEYVFDDRVKVVKMWRKLGLTVLAVAEGDF